MKDNSFWIVVEEGKSLASGIRCDGGKSEAKNLRKEMEQQGGKWKALKTTKKEIVSSNA